ncbi:Asp-tRNA(Asn)/Glu-tRNA(Gln) amidotransferase subunit GatA [Candidatus Uhrbacteria bacterium]|nr:Asp-tRNA(Asn)/Glu-tRNA(Gln) amidotransferase subunit GatA [Candidatus Uhrbacteria bacterium]
MKLNELTIAEARKRLDAGDLTSTELTKACIAEIKNQNPTLNAFIEVYEDDALEQALRSDERHSRSECLGALDGVPLGLKDNLLNQGKEVTSGSNILKGHISAYDATAVRKLKGQGAVILGRTNMDEFAMGSSTEHSAYGPTKNPHDLERVPGGSSGGSAVAVAAKMALGALGSDTGGSIRQPAALCGTVGLKPTYGRISRSGLMAMASSLDQIGPFAKTAEDAALILEALQGPDSLDQTTSNHPLFVPEWKKDLSGVRIGLPRQAWGAGMHDEVRSEVMRGVEALKERGAEIKEVDLPYADEALAVYYVVMPCEVSANLARFDGMRYGLRVKDLPLFETYAKSRAKGFGPEARRRILLGTYALSRGYYDAYYLQAKRVQTLIRKAYEQAFTEVDMLVTPTAPNPAFRLGEKTTDPLTMYLEDVFTVGVNVAGLPAVSVPCGKADGMPVGMQLIGRHFDEAGILAAARIFEESD